MRWVCVPYPFHLSNSFSFFPFPCRFHPEEGRYVAIIVNLAGKSNRSETVPEGRFLRFSRRTHVNA